MEQTDREFLQKNHVKLSRSLAPGISDVLEYLWSANIITEDMKDRVSLVTNPKKKQAADLLLLLPTRGPNAFQALYDAAVDAGLHEMADILKPGSSSHYPDYSKPQGKNNSQPLFGDDSDDEALPDVWPIPISEHAKPVYLKTYEDASSKEKYQNRYESHCNPTNIENYYQMVHRSRGPCLILSNEKFDNFDDRIGNKQDQISLNALFHGLGFDVDIKPNQTKEGMWNALTKAVRKVEGKTDIDCFILIILSHGDNGVIYGTDGKKEENSEPQNCIRVEAIRDLIAGVKSLKRLPKLFFFQACRGKARDYGQPQSQINLKNVKEENMEVETPENAPTANPSTASSRERGQQETAAASSQAPGFGNSMQQSTNANNHNQEAAGHVNEESQGMDLDISLKPPISEAYDTNNREVITTFTPPETSHDAAGETLHTLANFFIAMSTTAGSLSFRNTASGTWFIQAIVYIFSRFAYKHDIDTMMTKVNMLVSKAEDSKGAKQICERLPYLLKKFYFFPKLYKIDY